jgi:hypothetical protein
VTTTLEIDVDREWVPAMPTRPEQVRMVLVSECAAADDADNYDASNHALFDVTTLAAFASAGLPWGHVHVGRDPCAASYLQAGPKWYVEAGKRRMIAEDLSLALSIAGITADR